jgi:hypothetical protein
VTISGKACLEGLRGARVVTAKLCETTANPALRRDSRAVQVLGRRQSAVEMLARSR